MSISLRFYLKHHHVYSDKPLACKFVQMNCPDISKSKSRFLDQNNLFACLQAYLEIIMGKSQANLGLSLGKSQLNLGHIQGIYLADHMQCRSWATPRQIPGKSWSNIVQMCLMYERRSWRYGLCINIDISIQISMSIMGHWLVSL